MWSFIGKVAVGYVFARFFFSILRGVYSCGAHIFRFNLNLSKTGKWAVVTGATDGIGKAYAFELARRGLNIVLVSRSALKLKNVALEIEKLYPVETKMVVADFSNADIYPGIGRELKNLDIGVLVNNVGMGYDYPECVSSIPDVEEFSDRLLAINVQSVCRMTYLVLPGMEARGRGVIINISSLSAIIPAPLLTIYGATKAFVESFSNSLRLECKSKGVTVQCVLPGFVVSNLSKVRRASLMVPTPQAFVSEAIKTVGVEGRTGGYVMHKLMIYGLEAVGAMLPRFVLESHVMSTMTSTRAKALKRRQRDQKQQ